MNDGIRIAQAIAKKSKELREHARRTKDRKREIENDDDLTTEAKKIALRQLREEAYARHRKIWAEIERLQAKAEEWVKLVRVSRPVDDEARERVRDMLAERVPAARILERAVELGDAETIAALRAAMLWYGNKDGFADTKDTIAACDRALAEIARGEEGEVNRGLVRISEANQPVTETGEWAAKVQLEQDTPRDLLQLAYATGAGQEPADD
jgi:hypothetical protein